MLGPACHPGNIARYSEMFATACDAARCRPWVGQKGKVRCQRLGDIVAVLPRLEVGGGSGSPGHACVSNVARCAGCQKRWLDGSKG